MDRITESLLDDFSEQNDLENLPEAERFEHFASYVTVRRQHSETFDSGDIVCGAGNDTGIDAIAILVNGLLVTDLRCANRNPCRGALHRGGLHLRSS